MGMKLFFVQASVSTYNGIRKYTAFTIAKDRDDAIGNVKRKHLSNTRIIGIFAYEYSPLENGVVFGSDMV